MRATIFETRRLKLWIFMVQPKQSTRRYIRHQLDESFDDFCGLFFHLGIDEDKGTGSIRGCLPTQSLSSSFFFRRRLVIKFFYFDDEHFFFLNAVELLYIFLDFPSVWSDGRSTLALPRKIRLPVTEKCSFKSKCLKNSEVVNGVISQHELNWKYVLERGELYTRCEFQTQRMSFDSKTANEIVPLSRAVSGNIPLFSGKHHPVVFDAPTTNQSHLPPNGSVQRLLFSLISLDFVS